MKILITGGSGFIGSNLIRHLLIHSEHSILNLDKLTYAAAPQSLAELSTQPRYRFVQADICERPAVAAVLAESQPDAIIHLAAETHVDRSLDAPHSFAQTNIMGTLALLEATRGYLDGGPARARPDARARFRFLHVSTDEVYGSLDAPSAAALAEGAPYAPRSPYAASKAAADHLVRAWAHSYVLPILITHCSNNYGPYQFPEKLIPLALLKALRGEPIPIYGDGLHRRDWLHVDDHARALTAVLERGALGHSYHIGSGNELPNIELARQLCTTLDELRPRADAAPYSRQIHFVADRPGHDLRYALDCSKIRRELGWAPRHDLAAGLRTTAQWYLDNPAWWQPLVDKRNALQRLGAPRG